MRTLTIVVAVGLTAGACTHVVSRQRVILGGKLGRGGATIELVDEVQTERSCAGRKALLVTASILTFGLVWVISSVVDSKSGKTECPERATEWERRTRVTTAIANFAPTGHRPINDHATSCWFTTDDDCVVKDPDLTYRIATSTARGHAALELDAGGMPRVTLWNRATATSHPVDLGDSAWRRIGRPLAIDPSGTRVIVKANEGATSACWMVTRATNAAVRYQHCDNAWFIDRRTAWIGKRLVDLDSGESLDGVDDVIWLGGRLGLAQRGHHRFDVVRRGPWSVLASVMPIGVIEDPGRLTIIGATSIVEVTAEGAVAIRPLSITGARVLEVNGDYALIVLANQRLATAIVRLSTGQLIARADGAPQ